MDSTAVDTDYPRIEKVEAHIPQALQHQKRLVMDDQEEGGSCYEMLARDYRAKDRRWVFDGVTLPKSTFTSTPAAMTVAIVDQTDFVEFGASGELFGWLNKETGKTAEVSTKLSLYQDTQFPSIKIHIKGTILGEEEQSVTLRFGTRDMPLVKKFASNDVDLSAVVPYCFQWYDSNFYTEAVDAEGRYELYNHAGELRELFFRLQRDSGHWMGLSKEQRLAIRNTTYDSLSKAERMIVALMEGGEIHAWIPCKQLYPCDRFLEYFSTVMYLAKQYGECWYYTSEEKENRSIHDPNFDFEDISPPHWLVSKWLNTYERRPEDDVPCASVPYEWGSFEFNEPWLHIDTLAFLQKLGASRNKQEATKHINRLTESANNDGGITAIFETNPSFQPGWLVYVSYPENAISGKVFNPDEVLIPQQQTRLNIGVGNCIVQGSTCDFRDPTSTFLAYVELVSGPITDVEVGESLPVAVEFIDNPTPHYRQVRSIDVLRGMEKSSHEGADFRKLVLKASDENEKTDIVQRHWNGLTDERRSWIMGLLLSAADINAVQSAAVMKALNSRTAISYVSGPPGTGKTKTMATIMSAYDLLLRTSQLPRNFENKVIGVSHSNTGTDQLLRAWEKQYLEIHGHLDVEYCRFVNVPFRVTQVDPDKLRTAAMPEDDDDSNLYRQQLEFNMVLPEVVKNLGELTNDLFP